MTDLPTFRDYDTRVAAYAVIIEDGRILLSWYNGHHHPGTATWTLPGGGVEFGEQIEEAVVREVKEETGYDVELTGFLTTHTLFLVPGERTDRDFRSVRLVYTARVTGGALGTLEVDGSTDRAEWITLASLAGRRVPRALLVDVGLAAAKKLR